MDWRNDPEIEEGISEFYGFFRNTINWRVVRFHISCSRKYKTLQDKGIK